MPRRRSTPHDDPPKAILDSRDICVALGNAAADNDQHDALPGYRYDTPNQDEIGCWVPANVGDRFCIHVGYEGKSLPYPNAGLYFEVHLDGLAMLWSFVDPQTMLDRINQVNRKKRITTGDVEITGDELPDNTLRPLRFSVRQTTEAGDGILPRNIKDFGQIDVVVRWTVGHVHPVFKKESPSPDAQWAEEKLALLQNPINEKLKPVDHRCIADIGEAEVDPDAGRRRRVEPSTFDVKEGEGIRFRFKYRDTAWLEMEGIAPRRTESKRPAKRRKVTVDAK
ncbi:hypothetical protein FS749_002832 [Ceratobasidium sp. UAMH 11750]|nr:hypothetical protein FS749_002832 [Ceratobasidium sp. UAMH 11750]